MSRSSLGIRRSAPGRNFAAPLGAGLLVMVGTYLLIGTSGDSTAANEDLLPSIVAIEPIALAVSLVIAGVFIGVIAGVDKQRDEHDDEHATGEGRDPRARGCPVLGPPEEAGVGDEDEVVVAVKVDV